MASTDTRAPAVLIPTATEAGWLEARRAGITASEIAVVMGLSPYSSPYALYHQKLGVLPGPEETDAMALGKHMESFIADRFAGRHPELLVAGTGRELYAHPDRPWQMATPDRLVTGDMRFMLEASDDGSARTWEEFEPLAVLECKADGGSQDWGDDGSDQIPVHYRAQVLWQMDVMGVTTGYVACLLWNRRTVQVYEIAMDWFGTEDLTLMRREAVSFLDRIERQEPPGVDWRPATADALKRLHPSVEDRSEFIPRGLARRYRAACKAVRDAERRRDLAANQIRARMGNARYATTGSYGEHPDTVARRDVYGLPEKTITRKASTVDRLVPVTPRKATP